MYLKAQLDVQGVSIPSKMAAAGALTDDVWTYGPGQLQAGPEQASPHQIIVSSDQTDDGWGQHSLPTLPSWEIIDQDIRSKYFLVQLCITILLLNMVNSVQLQFKCCYIQQKLAQYSHQHHHHPLLDDIWTKSQKIYQSITTFQNFPELNVIIQILCQ